MVLMIIALKTNALAVAIGAAQEVMVVIGLWICRENVLGFGHHLLRMEIMSGPTHMAFTSSMAL